MSELSGCKAVALSSTDKSLFKKLRIVNPKFISAQEQGIKTYNIPEFIRLYLNDGEFLYIPRNFPFRNSKVLVRKGTTVDYKTDFSYRPMQEDAVKALLKNDNGVLIAPCGVGKTCIALFALAHKKQKAIVVVHTTELFRQWQERTKEFLDIDCGFIGDGKIEIGDHKIVIALVQSLMAIDYEDLYPQIKDFGVTIVDEVHRIGAEKWALTMYKLPAKVRWGLTATEVRGDGMQKVYQWHIGKIIHRIEDKQIIPKAVMLENTCGLQEREFVNKYTKRVHLPKIITALTKVKRRNARLINLVCKAYAKDRYLLLLTSRVDHCSVLKEMYHKEFIKRGGKEKKFSCGILTGTKRDDDVLDKRVVIATEQMAEEGLDNPRRDTLLLCTPFSSARKLQQSTGRIRRENAFKMSPVIIDFVDWDVEAFHMMGFARLNSYKKLKYDLKLIGEFFDQTTKKAGEPKWLRKDW